MPEQSPILVLVTLQRACARLIRSGADLAMLENRPLMVLHVARSDDHAEGAPAIDAQVLDYLYALSGEAGAEMFVLTAEVPVTAMANFAAEHGVKRVLMGSGELAEGIAQTLSQLLPGVQVQILEENMSIL